MAVYRVGPLPEGALKAAAEFHSKLLPEVLALLNPPLKRENLVIVFLPAPFDHRGWRLAAVQNVARAAAPMRVNGIVGNDEEAIAAILTFLENSPGITGQLLAV